MTQPDISAHTALPISWETSETPDNNGAFHLYLLDAFGKKIAAIWGPRETKLDRAKALVEAFNADRDMRAALHACQRFLGSLVDMQEPLNALDIEEAANLIIMIDAATTREATKHG